MLIFWQNAVAAFGGDAGTDAYADPLVASLLEEVRSRLSKYATASRIGHPPSVVAGIEEMLHKIESEWKLIGEYTCRVEEGSMTQAEADKHFVSVLTVGPDPHHVHSSSATVSQALLQTAPPIPTNSEDPVPSCSSAPRTSPAVVADPPEVTVRPAPNPVRQDAVASSSSCLVCTVYSSMCF